MTKTSSLRPRPARVLPATIAAVLLIAVGVLLTGLAIMRLQDGQWPSAATFMADVGSRTWGSRSVAAGGGLIAIAGLVLLLCGILPGRPSPRSSPSPQRSDSVGSSEAVVTRRGTERLVENRVNAMDGVGTCKARMKGTSLSLTVRTPLREHGQLSEAVKTAAREILSENLDGALPALNVRMVSTS
ncbi:DUF6286 domain-containing protein [Arthrobacter rhombi]|uniref:DUF6286 domain-containing protein n=1 Tax=Arthrobacter rhombi TaxID=71253 RepID=UPI003FD31744